MWQPGENARLNGFGPLEATVDNEDYARFAAGSAVRFTNKVLGHGGIEW